MSVLDFAGRTRHRHAAAPSGVRDTYRARADAPIASMRGRLLIVKDGSTLPRICVLCGGRKKLRERRFALRRQSSFFVAGPAPLVLFLALLFSVSNAMARTATLTLSTCTPCELRARDRAHAVPFVVIGALVGLFATATAGFNGHPWVAAFIALATAVALVVAFRIVRRIPAWRLVAVGDDGGVALAGFHPAAIDAILLTQDPAARGAQT
jgi:hypothetical protein